MAPPETQANFIFVNVSASEPNTEKDRSKILRHVQGYRRRKKKEDTRRLLRSSGFHQTDAVAQVNVVNASKQLGSIAEYNERPPPRLVPVLPPLMSVILLNADLKHIDAAPDVSSTTFGSLIGFERDCVHPAMERMESQVTHSSFQYSRAWFNDTKAYLYDNLAVYSFLSRITATMHMVAGSEVHRVMAHEYRNKAIVSLQGYLQDTVRPDASRLYRALVILILAESALGDRDALRIHTNILQDLVQAHSPVICSDPLFSLREFLTIIYQDVQIAVLNLTHTFFDIHVFGWIDRHFQPLWQDQSAEWLRQTSLANQSLHPRLVGSLRRLYTELRVNMAMVVELRHNPALLAEPNAYLKAFSRGVFLLGRLINFYDSLDINDVVPVVRSDAVEIMEEAIACLCAIYWLREFFGIESVLLSGSLRIFTANGIILTKLKDLVQSTYLHHRGELGFCSHQTLDLELWASFTGASIESALTTSELESQRQNSGSGQTVEQSNWFRNELHSVLQAAHLTSQEFRARLNAFILLEHLEGLCQFNQGYP